MTRDAWLSAHPYLEPLARFCVQVDGVAAELDVPTPDLPRWDAYAADFGAGVPLLRSESVEIELEPAGALVGAMIDALARSSPGKVEAEARGLKAELARAPGAARRGVDWLLGDESFVPSSPGLLRYLGWTSMARYLRPITAAFAGWRDEERWLRNYCPACGAPPAMAQLIGVDPGRKRFISCGCCGSRWRYPRTACPFCENESLRLGIVTIEGEAELRIDYCESCRGYLKTYNGVGKEALMLADWTTIHLDLVARDRGLKRLAASLYDLETATTGQGA